MARRYARAIAACNRHLGRARERRRSREVGGREVDQGNLISALNDISAQVDRVDALDDLTISDVRVVYGRTSCAAAAC